MLRPKDLALSVRPQIIGEAAINKPPKLFREEFVNAFYTDKASSVTRIIFLLVGLGIILYDSSWNYFFCVTGMLLCLCMNFILVKDGYVFFKKIRSPTFIDYMIFFVMTLVNVLVFLNIWPYWQIYVLIWIIPWIPYVGIRYLGN